MKDCERSEALLERAKASIAGGVNSNVRLGSRATELFFVGAQGSRIFDVDGHEYVDYILGQGPLVLGHSHPRVLAAVGQAMMDGQLYAGQHEQEVVLAETLLRLIPCAELVRLGLTGSEMVHAALRLARAHTGRQKIVKFEGHYHGWFDNILVSVAPSAAAVGGRDHPQPVLGSAGQSISVLDDLIILPWNDLPLLEETMRIHGHAIAGVIMEPIMCNTGAILPREGYLEGVRRLCDEYRAVLIFDEVITGFRVALGGAQALLGVTPDLAIFGKAMANGFPVSALAGRHEIMDLLASKTVNHSGTFNAYVPGVAAALATLEELETNGVQIYDRLKTHGQQLMEGLQAIGERLDIACHIQGAPVIFHLSFGHGSKLSEYRDYLGRDQEFYGRFCDALLSQGVRVTARGVWNLSTAHTPDDLEITLEAVEAALREVTGMRQHGKRSAVNTPSGYPAVSYQLSSDGQADGS